MVEVQLFQDRKEDEEFGKQQMMNKFLESAANEDQSLPYGPNHWTKDDPMEAGSDRMNWRRCSYHNHMGITRS